MGAGASPLSSFALEIRPSSGAVVGRPVETEAIDQALDAAAAGRIRAVVLEGEPGIGKTHLVERAASWAADRGFGVLTAVSDEELRGPLLVARSLFGSDAAAAAATHAGAEESLARLLRALSGAHDPEYAGLGPEEQLIRLYDLAAVAVRDIASRTPLAFLLDDVQWADEDSVRLLRYVLRTSPPSLFLLLASRPEEAANTEAATLVADLQRQRIVQRLRLRRFDQVETGELLRGLLGGEPSPSTTAAIHAQAEGVPFIVEELAHAYRDAGLLQPIEGVWQLAPKAERLLPSSVETLIRRRATRLPEAAAVSLAEAAVLGRTFGLGDLSAVKTQLGEVVEVSDLAEALAPAVEAGLVNELPEGWAADYRFSHEQVRSYALATLPRTRRREIHAAVVDLLMAQGDPPPESVAMLAHHALAAGMADRCARFSAQAGVLALEAHAPDETLRLVDGGLGAATNPEDRVGLLRLKDDALAMLRRTAERLDTLPQLSALAEALGDRSLEAETMLRRAAALRTSGEGEIAAGLARRARDLAVETGDRRLELEANLELGQALLGSPLGEGFMPPLAGSDPEAAAEVYARAAELAGELGDVAAEAAAERERGVAAMPRVRKRFLEWRERSDRPADYREYEPLMTEAMGAVAHFQRALELYEECGDRAGMMSTIISIAYGTKGADARMGSARRIEEIRRLVTQQRALTRESDRDAQEAQTRYGVHLYARAFGFPDLALERGRETFEAARRTGDRSLEFLAAGGMALAHLSFGELSEAAGWLERAAAAAAAAPTPLRARQLEMWKGMTAAAGGDAEGTQDHLERALAMATEQGKAAGRCEVLARLALDAALLGWRTEDLALLEVAERRGAEALAVAATLPGDHPWTAQAETALALAAHRGGRLEEAREAAIRGFAGLESTGMREIDPPYPLHLDVVLGVTRVLADDPGEDGQRIRSQVGAILRLAAERTADEDVRVRWFRGPVQRELAELVGGFEPPERPAAEPAPFTGLTDREADLLRLVTDGKTNGEIADELGVEEDRVARQLAEIYAKLGVSSRAGATVFAFMAGVS